MGPEFRIHYWRISVALGSGLAGFNCTLNYIRYRKKTSEDPDLLVAERKHPLRIRL